MRLTQTDSKVYFLKLQLLQHIKKDMSIDDKCTHMCVLGKTKAGGEGLQTWTGR